MQKAEQVPVADELYKRVIYEKLITHWHPNQMYTLDFHEYTTGLVLAAMRLVPHDMKASAIDDKTTARHSDAHVHDAKQNLLIITGHAMNRADKSGSPLQPCITDMLQQLNISSHINSTNKGRLIVPSQQLLAYCSRCGSG
eukprot:1869-Heterococcus_DN1.PRE.1